MKSQIVVDRTGFGKIIRRVLDDVLNHVFRKAFGLLAVFAQLFVGKSLLRGGKIEPQNTCYAVFVCFTLRDRRVYQNVCAKLRMLFGGT